jgi:hypothetical protein
VTWPSNHIDPPTQPLAVLRRPSSGPVPPPAPAPRTPLVEAPWPSATPRPSTAPHPLALSSLPPSPSGGGLSRLFGGRRRQDLEAENTALHAELERLRGMTGAEIAAHVEHSRRQLATVLAEIDQATEGLRQQNQQLAQVRAQIVETDETALLQEAGLYDYRHRLDDAVAYKARLDRLKQQMRTATQNGRAVLAVTDWTVNGSARDGRKMVADFSKLMLRAHNAEADNCVRTVRPHNRAATVARLSKTRDTIARLGKTMRIRIADSYHRLRVDEIELTADHAAKVEEEKEQIRAQREAQREEEKARKEYEREKARLLKERAHVETALAKLRARGGDLTELEAKLHSVDEAIAGVGSREANIRAGFVYVISNIGAFGPDIVKIGLTRPSTPVEDNVEFVAPAASTWRRGEYRRR